MTRKDESKSSIESASDILLPSDFEKKVRERFEKLVKPEITFEQYFQYEKAEFSRQTDLEANPALRYKPSLGTKTPCGNGDFENGLDPAEWEGAYGTLSGGGMINFSTLTAGILSGGITDGIATPFIQATQAHQTWVGPGTDPNVPIPTTASGSSGAIRLGNAVNGQGCELLSKTFVVTPAISTLTFWYAVVLQNPSGHDQNNQPFFWVRVTDASGNIVLGAFNFGNGSDKLIADLNNPFFEPKEEKGQEPIVYKDWSCAQIDLSSQVGKQVTVEFVTADCGFGKHWGYAYIDSFCGDCEGSPTGNITYNCEASSHCGPGQICFDYSLPTTRDDDGSIITGNVEIVLYIYQNGAPLDKISSGVLTGGSSYCFNITPSSIPGLDPTLGGFDFTATGVFAIGTTPLGNIKVGTELDGVTPGVNNDYQIACTSCEEIIKDQNAYLSKDCSQKVNLLSRVNCDCPDSGVRDKDDCDCDCKDVRLPDLQPCISIAWGDSPCDCMETDDVEIMCITVCNCYSNVTFNDLSIGRIKITDMAGNPVPTLPDGTPSVQVIPSGPICFGDIRPCKGENRPGCVSRELVLYTRGAVGKDYKLSFEGVCFTVTHHFQSEQCFVVSLCKD